MLDELHVHNYAIIEKLQVRFAGGLNVLTGETGAGKSILIGALGLLLGDRTDTSIVRAGAEEAAVSGVIRLRRRPRPRRGSPPGASAPRTARSSCAGR